MFEQQFDSIIVDGDFILCEVDGFRCRATAHFDHDSTPTGDFDEDSPYVQAWKRDEWHYFGIVVTIWRDAVQLVGDSRWGIDCNVPGFDNSYCREVANELLPGALAAAKARIAKWAKEVSDVA